MIGVSLDDNPTTALEFFNELDLPWIVTNEDGRAWDNSVVRLFGITGIPRTVIIGSDGRVRTMEAGPSMFLENNVRNVFGIEDAERAEAEAAAGGGG